MKSFVFALWLTCCFSFSAGAATMVNPSGPAAGGAASTAVDKTHLEGWVTKVNYQKSSFRLMDPRGFERTVMLKPGHIAGYRLGDHVKVTLEQNYPYATLVEKL